MKLEAPALYGGFPAVTRPLPKWPQWGRKEEENLLKALEAGEWGTLGKQAVAFSKRFAAYLNVPFAISVNNGTQALELLLRGCAIGRGDEVILPAYVPFSLASAIAYVGAMPVFCDIDEQTGCMDASLIPSLITERTKAILAFHPCGRPCDMDALSQIARDHSLLLLEECTHAPGSFWKGRPCGAWGNAAVFGFDSQQALTGGEGGLIATADPEIHLRAWHYHHSGRTPWNPDNQSLNGKTFMGSNGRMAEWEAAVLDAQMDELESRCHQRARQQKFLRKKIQDLPGILLPPEDERSTGSSGSFFSLRFAGDRDQLIQLLKAEGVPCMKGFSPLPFEKIMQDPAFEKSTGRPFTQIPALPHAEKFFREDILIPGSVFLADQETMEEIAHAIQKAVCFLQSK